MATKTTKSPARKSSTARKPAKSVPQKTTPVKPSAAKPKPTEKAAEPKEGALTSASAPEKPTTAKKMETLSLIDEVKAKPKPPDGEAKAKKTILPPISRLIAKTAAVELPVPLSETPPALESLPTEPPVTATAEAQTAPIAATEEPEAAEEAKNIIV